MHKYALSARREEVGVDGVVLPAVVGAASETILHDGRRARVVQLNNAATTPPFVATMAEVDRFLGSYQGVRK